MGWDKQSDDGKHEVLVNANSPSNRSGEPRTDILIVDKENKSHNHMSIGTGQNDGLIEHHGQQQK